MDPVNIEPGATIDGRFRIERPLGAGGAGVVFAATDLSTGTAVAVKFLHVADAELETHRKRFTREAAIATRLSSPHVARLVAFGEMNARTPYLAMELVFGEDLGTLLRKHGRFPVETTAIVGMQVCHAVGEAHQLGIVHRDLKPENLMITRDEAGRSTVKVLDFGASKQLDANLTVLTKAGTSIGSPYYMSPEQFRSAQEVDARSDVWSLGIVLFQLLTAAHPFPAKTPAALVIRVERGAPTKLSALRPEAPPELGAVLERCLQKNKSQRFQSMAELRDALQPFAYPPPPGA